MLSGAGYTGVCLASFCNEVFQESDIFFGASLPTHSNFGIDPHHRLKSILVVASLSEVAIMNALISAIRYFSFLLGV